MKLFRRPRPTPQAVPLEDVIRGMQAFIADAKAGLPLALEMAGPQGEMPMDAQEWAEYANDPYRLEELTALNAGRN